MGELTNFLDKHFKDLTYDVIGLYFPGVTVLIFLTGAIYSLPIFKYLGFDIEIILKIGDQFSLVYIIVMPYILGTILQGWYDLIFNDFKTYSDEELDEYIRILEADKEESKESLNKDDKMPELEINNKNKNLHILIYRHVVKKKIKCDQKTKKLNNLTKHKLGLIKNNNGTESTLLDKYIAKRVMYRSLLMGTILMSILYFLNLWYERLSLINLAGFSRNELFFKNIVIIIMIAIIICSLKNQIKKYTRRVVGNIIKPELFMTTQN